MGEIYGVTIPRSAVLVDLRSYNPAESEVVVDSRRITEVHHYRLTVDERKRLAREWIEVQNQLAALAQLDPALADAARSLGAGPVATFLRITVPIATPAILAGSLMAFVICFNNFTVQLFLAPLGDQTLPVEIYSLVRVGVTPDVNALASFIVVGSVLLIVALQLLGANVARTLTGAPGGRT